MDSFESVVSAILNRRGYWTQTSVKVELTLAEKREIKRHSSPRWELDVVGYRGDTNELLVVECKSFLDSVGVQVKTFAGQNPDNTTRYKLFFDDVLRRVVLDRLVQQLTERHFCRPAPVVTLALAAGKVKGDEAWLGKHLKSQGFEFFGPTAIKAELESLSNTGYENSLAAVVVKILRREEKPKRLTGL